MSNWKYINEVILYDGTFLGLLTVVFDLYAENIIPIKICVNSAYETNILDSIRQIETNQEKAYRIYNGLIKNISYNCLFNSYNAFLSGTKNKEIFIVKYLLNSFKIGSSINNMLTLDYVFTTLNLKKSTLFETHRLKGLVKFRLIGSNIYYAPIHPDNNIIVYIGKHFVKRIPNENFIIHDKNRNLVFVYNKDSFYIDNAPSDFKLPEFSDEERLYQDLWKTFFKTISIKERLNKKLQMQYIPKKYWIDLIEL